MSRPNNIYSIFVKGERVFYGNSYADFVKSVTSRKNVDMLVHISSYR